MSDRIARALSRNAPLSPQKGRLVADQIRGKMLAPAVEILKFSRKKAAQLIGKTLNSAIANAEEKAADIDALRISRIEVSDGMMMKRAVFGARGRVSRIEKRRCHILIELSEEVGGGKGKRGVAKRGGSGSKSGGNKDGGGGQAAGGSKGGVSSAGGSGSKGGVSKGGGQASSGSKARVGKGGGGGRAQAGGGNKGGGRGDGGGASAKDTSGAGGARTSRTKNQNKKSGDKDGQKG